VVATLHESNDQYPTGEGSSYRPEIVPISQPAGAAGECIGHGAARFLRTLRKEHDLPAVGTLRQMSKRFHTLGIGQDVFGKRTELVCVRMLAGMEKFAHGV
jgi:hypothetical protein